MALALAAGGLALSGAVYPALARLEVLWPAKPLAAIAAAHPGCGFVVAGYSEPSLVFLTGNRVRFVGAEAALQAFDAPGCQVIALPAADAAGRADAVARVRGLDLGSGRNVDLVVYFKE